MNSSLGTLFVLIGVGAASAGMIMGFITGRRQSLMGLRYTQIAAYIYGGAMTLANVVMLRALMNDDFSVAYVAKVGSRATPPLFKAVSLWSSLEGSILFWNGVLGVSVGLFAWIYRSRYREYMGYALGTMLMVALFFGFLLAGPSDPFVPMFPVPADGPGPNPLLQNHILMAIHPPTLYFGYVGLAIPFGIAVAALMRGRISEGWLKPLRLWTLIPWGFLTIGIVLGAWWSYEVLGWGGYWAWDPVENASLLPWLAATGYLHSTVVQERKRILKAWTLSLVLIAFLLTLVGTFMTRSGVFNSVHAFSTSSIGPIFLIFIVLMTALSIVLVAGRSHLLEAEGQISSVASRETAFLVNNLLIALLLFTVFLGTIYPLVTEAFKGIKVSVGEPYFNKMAGPIGLALTLLMGLAPILPWGRPNMRAIGRAFTIPAAFGVAIAILSLALGMRAPMVIITFGVVAFSTWITIQEMVMPIVLRIKKRGEGFGTALQRAVMGNRRRYGGYIVHLSIFMIVGAVSVSQAYKETIDVSMHRGENFDIGNYNLKLIKMEGTQEPHRFVVHARLDVFDKENNPLGSLAPSLNYYTSQREPMGTPDVRTNLYEDLYVSLLSFEDDGSAAVLKVFVTPGVAWIWWSMPVMMFGTAISLWPRRRKVRVQAKSTTDIDETKAEVSAT